LDIFFEAANTVGVLSFALTGARVAKKQNSNPAFVVLCAVLTAFGGGAIFRDLVILNSIPIILENILSISPAILIVGVFLIFEKKLKPLLENHLSERLLKALDSLGLAAFICFGIDKALAADIPLFIAFFSGTLTALGGGLIAAFLRRERLKTILAMDLYDKLIAALCASAYLLLQGFSFGPAVAKLIVLVFAMTVSLLVWKRGFDWNALRRNFDRLIGIHYQNKERETRVQAYD
jgi:uncharacterized membrane protein YeiH